ncbi:MAG: ribonuclease J [Acholeplasmatales bacterium]|nr:ribonuclease J [Acholeplasmatales bacterium]
MPEIKIGALGGLGEIGKNLYIVEVDEKIFVLDCGIKVPPSEFFGIDTIIPDYKYLKDNVDRIEGIFLTHAHDDHINALAYMIDDINKDVYASNFTMALVMDSFQIEKKDPANYKLHVVNEDDVIDFKDVTVSFFRLTHSVPEAFGISINTADGSILYTGDYSFDQNVDLDYRTSFDKLSMLGNSGVLALLSDCYGARNISTDSYQELLFKLNAIFKDAPGRIIITSFSNDLRRIQQIIDVSLKYNKKVAIIGRKTQRLVDIAINLGYIKIPEESLVSLRYIDDKNSNNNPDMVVIVAGDRHEPYFMLQRMCKKIDRLINITSLDTIITMTTPTDGSEKLAAKTLDLLSRVNTRIHTLSKKILETSHATREEIKMMINITKPKYVIPVKGEFNHQYALIDIANEIHYDINRVIILDNGDFAIFNKSEREHKILSFPAGEILIDGNVAGDVNSVVIHDREQLSKDGILLVIANLNPKSKNILAGPEIASRGFINLKDNQDIYEGIIDSFHKVSEKMLVNRFVNWNDYKKEIKDEISRFLYKELQRSPVIIPIIIATDEE